MLLSSLNPTTIGITNSPSLDELKPNLLPQDYLTRESLEIYQANDPRIPILMYHSIDSPRYWIDVPTFRSHLEMLYKAGYSTIRMKDYLHNDFRSIPMGRKPILLTFDDQWASQFYYEDKKGTIISKNCVVGVLDEFAKQHPSFGKHAVFYLFFHRIPFNGLDENELWKKKIDYLLKNGYEIGSHTYDHSVMTDMTNQQIKRELDLSFRHLIPLLKDYPSQTLTLAYPGGNIPKNKHFISEYSNQGITIKASFKASGGFAKVPYHFNSGLHTIPRIEGSTENIRMIIQTATFQKQAKTIWIPKLFIHSRDLVVKWMQENTNGVKTHFFCELY